MNKNKDYYLKFSNLRSQYKNITKLCYDNYLIQTQNNLNLHLGSWMVVYHHIHKKSV